MKIKKEREMKRKDQINNINQSKKKKKNNQWKYNIEKKSKWHRKIS